MLYLSKTWISLQKLQDTLLYHFQNRQSSYILVTGVLKTPNRNRETFKFILTFHEKRSIIKRLYGDARSECLRDLRAQKVRRRPETEGG